MPVAFFFGSFGALLFSTVPIAVALGFSALLYLTFFSSLPLTQASAQLFSGLDSFPLVAIPLFILAASIMAKGGISEQLINAANAIVGRFKGGLAMTAVLACMFFAAISGSSPATVVAVGTLLIPSMVRQGYGKRFSTGLIATSGSLGILIPPSIPLIVYGVASDQSIGDLFAAGIVPGVLAGIIIMIVAVGIVYYRDLGQVMAQLGWRNNLLAIVKALPALFLPVLILGGIYSGIFTPTEAAAVAVLYSLIVSGLIYKGLKVQAFGKVLVSTVRTSSMIMFIIANAGLFAFVLTIERIPATITSALIAADMSPWLFLLVINVMLLVVGMFMETSSAILILTPILLPIALSLGIDPIHLGIIIVMNLEIGMITPPLGLNLFVSSGITGMPILQVAKAALPSALALLFALALVTYIPFISLGILG